MRWTFACIIVAILVPAAARAQFTESAIASGTVPSGQTLATSTALTVPAAPNLVVVSAIGSATTCSTGYSPTVSISNGTHTYLPTAHSPVYSGFNNCPLVATAYYINESAASETLTATFDSTSHPYVIMATSYSVSGGNAAYDLDESNVTTTNTATPIIVPSITPSGAGELLYGTANPYGGLTASGSPWTVGNNLSSGQGEIDIYQLSGPSGASTPLFYDSNNPDTWVSIVAAWKIVSAAVPIAPRRILEY